MGICCPTPQSLDWVLRCWQGRKTSEQVCVAWTGLHLWGRVQVRAGVGPGHIGWWGQSEQFGGKKCKSSGLFEEAGAPGAGVGTEEASLVDLTRVGEKRAVPDLHGPCRPGPVPLHVISAPPPAWSAYFHSAEKALGGAECRVQDHPSPPGLEPSSMGTW